MFVIIAHGSPIGGDGEAEELIAYADESEGSAAEPHFVGVQLKPNPHKRSAYRVRESSGLRSHFSAAGSARIEDAPFYVHDNSGIDGSQDSKVDDFVIFNSVPRSKRDAAVSEKSEKDSSPDDAKAEPLPSAEAQTMETGYYRRARSRLSDDSMAQASGTAEPGLRRVPRVNFITQPRTIDESPEHRDLKASNANVDPMYRRPPYDSYMPMPVHPQYSRNMGRGRFFDGNMGGNYGQTYGQSYDRYDQRDYMGNGGQRYDPYYYSTRYNQMGGGGYSNNNYNQGYYSDRRGYPDGYAQMRDPYAGGAQGGGAYMNDVNYMGYPNRRVIYYAHLPEIVRPTSPYGESRGQYYPNGNRGGYEGYGYDDPYYNSRPQYMDDYNYRYNRDMNQYGMAPLPQPPPSVIYSNNNNRIPERDRDRDQNKDTKNKDGNDSKTQTISSNIRIKDSPNKGYNNGNNYDSDNSRQGPSSSSDFTQPHYRME